jgi:hypothetical protein
MIMRKTVAALSGAAMLTAGAVALPTQANALPVWVIPAIIGAGVAGVVVGASAHPAYATEVRAYEEPVAVAPATTVYGSASAYSGCRIGHERINGRLRTVQICPVDRYAYPGY